jgi:hypothetical protein
MCPSSHGPICAYCVTGDRVTLGTRCAHSTIALAIALRSVDRRTSTAKTLSRSSVDRSGLTNGQHFSREALFTSEGRTA